MHSHYQVLGLMSGTSMDGVDMAICIFELDENGWSYEILAADCIPYASDWKQKLSNAKDLSGIDLLYLNNEYGTFLGNLCKEFLSREGMTAQLISSHGHTVFHEPAKGVSFQLGSGPAIVAATGLPVVCDYRSLDVCLGGQGAPLVPIGDELLFGQYEFCLNLGGIANISYTKYKTRRAYDVCPCNLLLNYFAELQGQSFDRNGDMARQGKISEGLLTELDAWEYYAIPAPKSLDKEELFATLLPIINGYKISINDKLATLTEHIAKRIVADIEEQVITDVEKAKVLVSGGGTFNSFLIDKLNTSDKVEFVIPSDQIINFKEALIFSFLGLLRVLNKTNTLASVTGANTDTSSGAVYRIKS